MSERATLSTVRVADRLLVSISRSGMSLALVLDEDEVKQWKEALNHETSN